MDINAYIPIGAVLGTETDFRRFDRFLTGFIHRKPAISEPVIRLIQNNRPDVSGSVISGRLLRLLSPTPYNACESVWKPLHASTPALTHQHILLVHSTQQRGSAHDSDA